MKRSHNAITRCMVLAATLASVQVLADEDDRAGEMLTFRNAFGKVGTFSTNGAIDLRNPFFQKLGTNGRSCDTCHRPAQGWSITPESVRQRFVATGGRDPIFRLNDGANSPVADVSTVGTRRKAYRMLLDKGLIRVGIGIPPDAEFELVEADDPYGYASAAELSLFRRPLPSANLRYLNAVMWDGRETFTDSASTDCIRGTSTCFAPLPSNLAGQANSATTGHAQGVPLTPAQRQAVVDFEMGLFVAQVFDDDAKQLTGQRANGGPRQLPTAPAYFGINDVVSGDYRSGMPFNSVVFDLYDAWSTSPTARGVDGKTFDARKAVARGQALFNTKPISISGVKGLNDDLGVPVLSGTCTTCHDSPMAGNHSIPAPLDIGIADAARATEDMPLYVLRNKATGDTIATTDPGRALISGRWKDIGRFKGPVLRALASRPPYFHNGSAPDLGAAVDFYNTRFGIGLTEQERADLVAFLRTL
ncbi:MAG: hypothetical protein ABI920_11320 [Casimicrobiaceae bacterium]